jgi:hypothetical protein
MARENTGWGYDRIIGAMAKLGHHLSDQTVGDILRRHGIAPAPTRSRATSWKDFISAHKDDLAGADFFTVGVLNLRGLVTYYVLFFIHLGSQIYSLRFLSAICLTVDHPNRSKWPTLAESASHWGHDYRASPSPTPPGVAHQERIENEILEVSRVQQGEAEFSENILRKESMNLCSLAACTLPRWRILPEVETDSRSR